MCNSRNYSWKDFVKNSFNIDSLMDTLTDPKFYDSTRA